jgi:hypothetical protein
MTPWVGSRRVYPTAGTMRTWWIGFILAETRAHAVACRIADLHRHI